MNVFLTDKPKVVVFPDFKTRNGVTQIVLNVATNVADNVEVVFTNNEDNFCRASRGQPFVKTETVDFPGD